ncbi:MAG: hypothetical protein EBS81_02190 [Gammaproteobacteria bacterium]|nr:hypothetical protein [Gammaproteobacteria bacterium]
MPPEQINPRDTLIMRLASCIVIAMLMFTVLTCIFFNLAHDGFWFVRSAIFLLVFIFLIWLACLYIENIFIRAFIAVLSILATAIFAAGRLVSFYYQGESFNEEFLFHFNVDTMGFALETFPGLAVLAFCYLISVSVAGYFSVFRIKSRPAHDKSWWLLPAFLFSFVLDPDITSMAEYSLSRGNASNMELATIDWEGTGLKREALYKSVNEISAGKNVVILYLESVEQMYTDEALYPGLTPFLTSLADEALVFSNIVETQGTNFTVAGILSSQCGTPLLFSGGPGGPGGNDILKNGFMQEAFCLGDILDAAGYHQVFLGGASTRFAGKGVFLSDHGYDEVYGLEELYPYIDDPSYTNNWGLFDDSLLEIAANKFDELVSESGSPFNFTVLTVDTHPPAGQFSRSCKPYDHIDNPMFHSVHCADQLVERFIGHLKQSPAWDDTVVMVMSDHLHMRNVGQDYYPEDYERKLLVYLLNAGQTGVNETPGAHMDIGPTLLSLMGVRHQQQFLAGDNLLGTGINERIFDPANRNRLGAIRYLNMNLLSRIESGLCEAEPLYSIERSNVAAPAVQVEGNRLSPWTIRVAGKEINLSRRGRVLPTREIGSTYALMSLVNTEGKVGLTFPVLRELLMYELYTHRDSNFFLLTTRDAIAELENVPDFNGTGLLFGNLAEGFEVLKEGIDYTEVITAEADCDSLLDQARELDEDKINGVLGSICENTVAPGFSFDPAAGSLQLESVNYGVQRFKADFTRNRQGWYTVTSFEELEPVAPEGSCDAYYGNQEILVPSALSGEGPVSIVLKKIPGIPLTFELDTVIPFAD